MSICLGWFAVRDTPAPRVIEELRRACSIANREDIPELFRVFDQPPRPKSPLWTLVLLEGTASQYAVPAHAAPTWAQALSLQLSRPTISFFLLEGGWSYAIFDAGQEVLAQESYTLPTPEVYGDRNRAGALLAIDPALFDKYEHALKEARDEPLPGDEFAPTDPWSHTDFARHIGLAYPDDPSAGTAYAPTPADRQTAGTEWSGLPARLPVPEPPPHPAAKGEEIDFDNFPSGDDPF
jgi:hypothetical protein